MAGIEGIFEMAALDKNSASQKLIAMLEEYQDMEPGQDKADYWGEIQEVMLEAAAELREISNQRPSGYIAADQLREQNKTFMAEMDKRVKKPSMWKLLFGRGK
jgi:hypothetical protein